MDWLDKAFIEWHNEYIRAAHERYNRRKALMNDKVIDTATAMADFVATDNAIATFHWDNKNCLNHARYEHVMVDFETLDTCPWTTEVSSVALQQFNPMVWDANLMKHTACGEKWAARFTYQPTRTASIPTLEFRAKHKIAKLEADLPLIKMLDGLLEMQKFCELIVTPEYAMMPAAIEGMDKELVVWAKPKEFDLTIWWSLNKEHGLENPWFYRNAMCVNTFCTANGFEPRALLDTVVDRMVGVEAHHPAHDNLVQIQMVREAIQGNLP